MCVHIIVHNCRTQHSTEQFWRQPSQLWCCLLEGRGIWHKKMVHGIWYKYGDSNRPTLWQLYHDHYTIM